MTPLARNLSLLLMWSVAALGSACASYPERAEGALRDFRSGHFAASQEAFASGKVTDSDFLAGAEAGTVALAGGEWQAAQQHFERAAEDVRELEERALVSVSELGESLASWVINDTLLAYPGEGFERVYLHVMLALCYLGQGQTESVLVEAKRADRLLEREQELYESEYRAGGLGHLLSAVAYELVGEPAEAWIDYQRMLEKDLGTDLAGRALVRLAHQLGREEELPALEARFGPDFERPPDAASIVLIGGVGLAPQKEEILLPVPTGDGLLQWAVPTYVSHSSFESGFLLSVSGSGPAVRSVEIESVDAVARENLEDRLAWLIAKGTVRTVLKRELAQQLGEQHGVLGQLMGDLFTFVSERADLRSWQTLPAAWHAARMYVPAGQHRLRLEAEGGGTADLGSFELLKGETMFVVARAIDGRLFAHAVGGRLVEAAAPPPAGEGATGSPPSTLQP